MDTIKNRAFEFFDACENGQGWAGCSAYCHPDATFSAQAGALTGIESLEGYTEWMKGLLTPCPDGRYELKGFAHDEERGCVMGFGVFSGTHTGEGGPVPPTGNSVATCRPQLIRFNKLMVSGGRFCIFNKGIDSVS